MIACGSPSCPTCKVVKLEQELREKEEAIKALTDEAFERGVMLERAAHNRQEELLKKFISDRDEAIKALTRAGELLIEALDRTASRNHHINIYYHA
jgi:hypothetical protein